ncbi:MAG: hypothetical protein LBT40_10110 [Deltaproteobacteria bacterium]|jgi:hypothetical protein|nr:hypothetical protein [Deltaproteobacteria bacterium]
MRHCLAPGKASPPTPAALAGTLGLVLALLLAYALPASAQDDAAMIYRNQKPMTQAEIPVVMELARFHFGTLSEWEAMHMANSFETDEDRLAYLTAKVEVALQLLGPDPPSEADVVKARGTRLALPTAFELELIKGMETELRALIPAGAR